MSGRAGRIEIERVSIALGRGAETFEAVQELSLAVKPGEFIAILGPSSCGKSTLLGALAGHVAISSGRLSVDGEPIAGPHPDRGVVFQHHTLFPWKTAVENVAFGPKCGASTGRSGAHRRWRCSNSWD